MARGRYIGVAVMAAVVAAAIIAAFAADRSARTGCTNTRVTSLAVLASEVSAGESVCLANGVYSGDLDLSNPFARRAAVTQEGAAVIHGQVRLDSSHLELNGLAVTNARRRGSHADCVRIEAIGGTDIRIVNSDLGACARDAIRMAFNRRRHNTAVTIQANTIHDAARNACTCYMRAGRFADNRVERIGNDALDLWGDANVVTHNVFRQLDARHHNHNDVLQTWRTAGNRATGDPLTNLIFERNIVDTVTGPDSHGLLIEGGAANHTLTIRSNLFRDVGSIGALLDGATGVRLFANTFARAGGLNTMEWKHGATGTIDSNIFYQAAGTGAQPWAHGATSRLTPTHRYNIAWGGKRLSGESTGSNANPRFYDASGSRDSNRNNDFRIRDATSPAIDHGNPAIHSRIDIRGQRIHNQRVDRGAFEYIGN